MRAVCNAREKTKPEKELASLFEQDLERACESGCDEEMSDSVLKLAALFIMLKGTPDRSKPCVQK